MGTGTTVIRYELEVSGRILEWWLGSFRTFSLMAAAFVV